MSVRSRDLGIVVGELPTGPYNAITDVGGVRVGHATVRSGDGVRTGVTVVEPRPRTWDSPVFAGAHRLNGNGEMTGLHWVRENGQLTTPIGLTNTHSVGVVRDALVARLHRERGDEELYFHLPVVAETYDGILSDINGQHVTAEHVDAACAALASGPVAEGSVGSGTGMVCHEFKGGIGTASRVVEVAGRGYVVGVLVQANHGRRRRLRVNGVPVGERIGVDRVPSPYQGIRAAGAGSIIVLVATDAPLLPHQCERLAQRGALGIARTGGTGENGSGDLLLAFSTGNTGLPRVGVVESCEPELAVRMVSNTVVDGLFDATVEATEEAILNALVAGRDTTGRHGRTAPGLDHRLLREAMESSCGS